MKTNFTWDSPKSRVCKENEQKRTWEKETKEEKKVYEKETEVWFNFYASGEWEGD